MISCDLRHLGKSRKAGVALVLLVIVLPADGQQYKWIDGKGRIQYSDTPPPPSAKTVQKKRFEGSVVESPEPYVLTSAVKKSPATLYTSPPCGVGCTRAREVLNNRGVPFREIQVWDKETNAELRRISGSDQVPVLLVGGQMQKGFEPNAFNRLLDLGGYPKAGVVRTRKQAPPPVPADYQPEKDAIPATATPPVARKK